MNSKRKAKIKLLRAEYQKRYKLVETTRQQALDARLAFEDAVRYAQVPWDKLRKLKDK